ncbi:MAG: winged helix-turn-helix domain-containing protein [Deltaproteobacteria bacterium]|nr:winged helix-turn-helix domain-containing protein [Deltaproteobacteria bacterium]
MARFLLTHIEMFDQNGRHDTRRPPQFHVRLSQEQIAQSLALAQRSVTRALKVLSDEGIVTRGNSAYIIHDRVALEAHTRSECLSIGHRMRSFSRGDLRLPSRAKS